ncbi:MAG: PDC sensor domain-containing protein, partial [Sulfurimicrobium sp.]|nr:PDC sensor domain-containing protein [Sulfurimicrobium sp.]
MKVSKESLQESVTRQREALLELLQEPLGRLAEACCPVWGEREKLNALLGDALKALPYCKHLYALDIHSIQISDNVSHDGLLEGFGRDRSKRPYMSEVEPSAGFVLSDAYISLRERRPSLTAIQLVRNKEGKALGFIGAYFGLRDLPLTRELYEEPRYWRQIKGDPSIRGTVFHQTRTESEMDRQIDTVLG